MPLSLDDTALKNVLAKALLEALPKEELDKILVDAVKAVMTDETEDARFGQRKTKLAVAVEQSVREFAVKWVTEQMRLNEAFRIQARAILDKGMNAVLEKLDQSIEKTVVGVIDRALRGDRY